MTKFKLFILFTLIFSFMAYAQPSWKTGFHPKNKPHHKPFKMQYKNNWKWNFSPDGEIEEEEDNYICKDSPEGLLIPLYSYDAGLWDKVINLDAYSVVAIVNPNSGVGDYVDPFYQEVIDQLVENGKTPIGYIYTSYGSRDIEDVKAEVDKWLEYYPNIKGFFLDEVSSDINEYAYYEELYLYIKSKGDYLVFLNAGTYPNEAYFNIADNIVIYENNPSYFDKSLCDNYPEKSSFIIYDADIDTMNDLMETTSCAYKYLTDDTLPNPYDTLPTYIDDEAEKSKGDCE